MTKDEAEALALKRNRHLSKHMRSTHVYRATHNSVKGWHVTLDRLHAEPLETTACDEQPALTTLGLAMALFGPRAVADALEIMRKRRA